MSGIELVIQQRVTKRCLASKQQHSSETLISGLHDRLTDISYHAWNVEITARFWVRKSTSETK